MSKLINYCLNVKNAKRCYSSALYITGDKAHNNFVALVPQIDFEETVENNFSDLDENIKARKLNIDLNKIKKRWNFYRMIDDHKTILEATRSELVSKISKLNQEPEKNKEEIEKLSLHRNLVRDDLRNVKDYSYGVEENAMLGVLSLPNILHKKTPTNSIQEIIHTFTDKPTNPCDSHIAIGQKNQLVQYTNPTFYFIKNEAAHFEFALFNYFQSQLLKLNFQQFSNADFARSIIVEGCSNHYLDPTKIFTLADPHNEKSHEISKLHLVGGASLYSFMAYFAKHLLEPNMLPLKLFSMGRSYTPAKNVETKSLLNVSQESVLRVFIACSDEQNQIDDEFNQLIGEIIKIYQSLGFHFRLVYLPANELEISESLRLSIQMYSNHLSEYVEIGNLSQFDNYLSKRLLFTYKNNNKERVFTKIISGELLNIPKVLACAIENNYSNNISLINNILKNFL